MTEAQVASKPLKGVISKNPVQIANRSLDDLPADTAAVKALAQAAVNVELFTIPLYMCALKSLQGTHPINAQGISYYKGRVWPGMATVANPQTANQKAYNTVFSVFIDEMLHLQLAANLCAVLGVTPDFNSPLLQDKSKGYAWTCYGPDKTAIPHIIDLTDTTYSNLRVNLDGLTTDQVTLFTMIEEPHDVALQRILPASLDKYFPAVPFAGWTAQSTEVDLPMFGTIGWMYATLFQYLSIEYTDGKLLWEKLFVGIDGQRDLFNTVGSGHPAKEYPGFPTQISATDPLLAAAQAVDIITGICDQGEGGFDPNVAKSYRSLFLRTAQKRAAAVAAQADGSVEPVYQPDDQALIADYPSYTDTGETAPSADASARSTNGSLDHYVRFQNVLDLIGSGEIVTWALWHANPDNVWTEAMLTTADYDPNTAPTNIPAPADVAGALNRLKQDAASTQPLLSQVATGAIAGITTVLTQSWGNPAVLFPSPSMTGSGDRMALVWAVFGQAPDLSQGTGAIVPGQLYHACQSLDFDAPGNSCAATAVFHSCRGSNSCKAQGGCGFAQLDAGGGNCSHPAAVRQLVSAGKDKGGCGAPQYYSSPSDNKCATFGGCAVPISASQLYPEGGLMYVYDFEGPDNTSTRIGGQQFVLGDSVYDKAWDAYTQVMANRGKDPGTKPAPSDLRVALPPST